MVQSERVRNHAILLLTTLAVTAPPITALFYAKSCRGGETKVESGTDFKSGLGRFECHAGTIFRDGGSTSAREIMQNCRRADKTPP